MSDSDGDGVPGIPFDPYDDSIPISQRMGMQHLGAESPPQPFDPEDRLMPELPDYGRPPPPTPINKATKRRLSKPVKDKSAISQLTPFQVAQQLPTDEPSEQTPDRRELASTCLEIVGMMAFSAGFWVLHVWLGLIVTGLCFIALGVATSDRFAGTRD